MRLRLLYLLLFITLGVLSASRGFLAVENEPLLSAADFILAAAWCYVAAYKIVGKK